MSTSRRTIYRQGRHAALYLLAGSLSRALTLILLPFATRVLSPESFGLVSVGLTVAALAALVFPFGLGFTVVRLYYDDDNTQRSTEWAALVRVQLLGSGLLGLAIGAVILAWPDLAGETRNVAILSLAYGWCLAATQVGLSLLRAQQRSSRFVVVVGLQVLAAGPLAIAMGSAWGSSGFLFGLIIGTMLAMGLSLASTYRRPRWNRTNVIAGIRLSLPVLAHSVSLFALGQSDRIWIAVLLGAQAVAGYQPAYLIGSGLGLLIEAVQSTWAPAYFASSERSRIRDIPSSAVVPATMLTICASLILVAISPVLVSIAAPSSYDISLMVVAIVASSNVVRIGYFIGVVVITDKRRTMPMAAASGIAAAVNVGLNLALIPVVGVAGAAIATLAAYSLQALVVMRASGSIGQQRLLKSDTLLAWLVGVGAVTGAGLLPDAGALGWSTRGILVTVALTIGLFSLRSFKQLAEPTSAVATPPLDSRPFDETPRSRERKPPTA